MEIKKLDEVWTADHHKLGLAHHIYHRLDEPNSALRQYASYLDVQNFEFGDDYYIPMAFVTGYDAATGRVMLNVDQETVLKETWTRMPDFIIERRARREGTLSELLISYAMDFSVMGLAREATQYANASVELLNSANDAPWPAPVILYAAGETAAGRRVEALLDRAFAQDQSYLRRWQPMIRARRALAEGDAAAAVAAIPEDAGAERAAPRMSMVRGEALLAAGRPQEAAAAFRRAYDARLLNEPSPLGPVSKIWLARALAKAGDTAGARAAYQDAFGIWKDADADLPLLVEARKEYAALQ